ncbi:hypothetical protein [Actinomycetospora termitidis]|uniref:Uncharacterized protein n=1 Tax=Actinomycetospora termitidis TaxID=3053470 RepID=A0ABT7MJA7_9PSEU|nr:hypothetical protein [Actinomycetospora sp. Odt1-22]MDL5159448.1 hypothetical protein [Actinomycetospora sp. Odt1-22]
MTSKTMWVGGVKVTASKAGGTLGAALVAGVLVVAALALVTRLLGSTAMGFAAANAAVSSAIGLVGAVGAIVLIVAAVATAVGWVVTAPRRAREAARCAEFRRTQQQSRATTAVRDRTRTEQVPGRPAQALPAGQPVRVEAVRLNELDRVRER